MKRFPKLIAVLIICLMVSSVAFASPSFPDAEDRLFENEINFIFAAGIADGYADGTFGYDDPILRGQMAKFIANMMDLDPDDYADEDSFPDAEGRLFDDYIKAIVAEDIAEGYADGTFGYDDPVLRGQMAKFIANALGLEPDDYADEESFPDAEGRLFDDYIKAIVAEGIADGYADGTFGYDDPILRGQMAKFIANSMIYLGKFAPDEFALDVDYGSFNVGIEDIKAHGLGLEWDDVAKYIDFEKSEVVFVDDVEEPTATTTISFDEFGFSEDNSTTSVTLKFLDDKKVDFSTTTLIYAEIVSDDWAVTSEAVDLDEAGLIDKMTPELSDAYGVFPEGESTTTTVIAELSVPIKTLYEGGTDVGATSTLDVFTVVNDEGDVVATSTAVTAQPYDYGFGALLIELDEEIDVGDELKLEYTSTDDDYVEGYVGLNLEDGSTVAIGMLDGESLQPAATEARDGYWVY